MWLKRRHIYYLVLLEGQESGHSTLVFCSGSHKAAIMGAARLHSFLGLEVLFHAQVVWEYPIPEVAILPAGCHLGAIISSERLSFGLSQHGSLSMLLKGQLENLALLSKTKSYVI